MSQLLILSDIHGNWPALQAVLAAESHYDMAVCCGDVVDYGPEPIPCLHWVRNHCQHVVRGNHDNALAFDVDCRCMGSFREYSLATRAWHRTLLSEANCEYLREMPTIDWFEFDGRHFRMAHATPPETCSSISPPINGPSTSPGWILTSCPPPRHAGLKDRICQRTRYYAHSR